MKINILDKYLIKNKNFNILIMGQSVSLLGSLMQSFALSLYTLKITGSGTQFAMVLSVSLIPTLILGPICGVFVDWFNRKKILITLDFISSILIAIMFLISIRSQISLAYIYICTIFMSIVSAFYNPAVSTVIPTIIDKDSLIKANSINNFIRTLINIIAPVLAGIIYGIYGITIVFFINSLSFISVAILELFMVLPRNNKRIADNIWSQFTTDFTEGFKFIIDKKIILRLVICAFIANIALNPVFSVGVPFICKMILKTTDAQYGISEAAIFAGSIVAPICVTTIVKKIDIKNMFYMVITMTGILMLFMSINVSSRFISLFNNSMVPFIMFLTIGFLIGLIITILNICLFTLIQSETPNELLGRTNSALSTLTMCAIPLGQILFGVLFDKCPSWIPILLSSLIFTLLGLVLKYLNKQEINSVVKSEFS